MNNKIQRIIVFLSFSCEYEIWSLTLRTKSRLWVSEKSAGRIFGYREELTGGEREYNNGDFVTYIIHQTLLG